MSCGTGINPGSCCYVATLQSTSGILRISFYSAPAPALYKSWNIMEGVKHTNLLLLSLALALVCSHLTVGMAQNSGAVKDAWPEYRFQPAETVAAALVASGLVAPGDVFIWGPAPNQSPPFNPGTDQSVWLYTTDDNVNATVYQIPQRGRWHPNRVNPGWVELVGEDFDDAIETITEEVVGVTVVYGPVGFPRTEDIRYDRVFLEVDSKGEVATVPRIG